MVKHRKVFDWLIFAIPIAIVMCFLAWELLWLDVVVPRAQAEIRGEMTITVTDKVIAPRKEAPGYFYLVYGFDSGGVYRTLMLDDWAERNNTSDWYGAITVGETYTIDTMGERIPALSQYPNIIGVQGFVLDENKKIRRVKE